MASGVMSVRPHLPQIRVLGVVVDNDHYRRAVTGGMP